MIHVTYRWVVSHVNEWNLPVEIHIQPSEWVLSCRCQAWPMNKSFHMRMGHVTCECDTSHMNAHEWLESTSAEPYSTLWQSHIIYEWVMSHMNELRDKWMSHVKAHHCNAHQPTAIHRSTLQHTATQRKMIRRHKREEATRHNATNKVRRAVSCLRVAYGKGYSASLPADWLQHAATHYNTLQHTATCCNTYLLWQGVLRTHCNTLQPISACCPPKK